MAKPSPAASAAPSGAAFYLQLAMCVAGIYTCYLVYGIFQEGLYAKQGDGTVFGATAFVLCVQCLVNAAIAGAGMLLEAGMTPQKAKKNDGEPGKPARSQWVSVLLSWEAVQTATVYVLAMYTSNEALQYVSYPMQALAKSCKMIPVLIGRVVILGHRYGWMKYVCVGLMTAGITIFQMSGGKKKGHGGGGDASQAEMFGLILLAGSLILDGVTGPAQETLKKKLSNMEQIVVNNVWAAAIMGVIAVVRGQVFTAIDYLGAHPNLVQALIWFSVTSALGQIFVFHTIRTFDSLTLSTITTTRKFFTIVASVLVYGHALGVYQWVAVAVVFFGLALEVADGEREKAAKRAKDKAETEAAKSSASAGASSQPAASPTRVTGKPHAR